MKPLKENNLLNRVVYHNVNIIACIVVLLWIYITVSLLYSTYQAEYDKSHEILHQFITDSQEEINRAIVHSEHIVRSSYIGEGLQKDSFSVEEMLEYFDYSKEILAQTTDASGIQIYHTNKALMESRFFSYTNRLADYHSILRKCRENSSGIIFDPTVITERPSGNTYSIMMYRQVPWHSDNILAYPITMNVSSEHHEVSVVHQSDALAENPAYYKQRITEDFFAVMPIPKAEIFKNGCKVFLFCLLVLIIVIYGITAMAKRTAKQTLKEINEFIETLKDESLLTGDKIFSKSYDLYELSVIQKTLQTLVNSAKESTLKLQSAELENKQLELDLLAMQLDPHMLYNSLASIRLDAYREKNKKILDLVDNMALYYRGVLKKDQKLIFLQNELETIQKYLYINELSQNKEYRLETLLEEPLRKLLIPPQFLHTFVENSIVHGLSGAKKDCLIRIQVTKEQGFVTIEIYDNGYGITPEKLKALNEGTLLKDHVGIDNSVKRMKLIYGNESSVRFESEKNVYTKVILRFRPLPEQD